jgi:hypothetical protein
MPENFSGPELIYELANDDPSLAETSLAKTEEWPWQRIVAALELSCKIIEARKVQCQKPKPLCCRGIQIELPL